MAGGVGSRANRWLTWFHRWVGVALCLVFFIWFATGAVLHFVDFPSLGDSDRYMTADAIDGTKLTVPPSDLVKSLPAMDDLRLVSIVGRPVYIVSSPSSGLAAFAGDSGERIDSISASTAGLVAQRFSGARARSVDGPLAYDQWIVHQRFDPYRPLYRVRIDDQAGTDLYVSARTGEVVQRTRRRERIWNWCGAVTHWIYFTPLRRNWAAWNQTVWWFSLVALLTSIAGTWLGVERFIGNRAAGRRGLSPFRRWMKWHHVIGLFTAVIVLAWILSGWLSMDHGRFFSTGQISGAETDRIRGMSFSAVADQATLNDVRGALPATQIDFGALAGRPFLLSRGVVSRQLWFPSAGGETQDGADGLRGPDIQRALSRAWPGARVEAVPKDGTDALYRLAESVPVNAFGANVLLDSGTIRVYVDRYTGHVLTAMNTSRRGYAWIYYALHTLNFPILLRIPLIRTLLVLTLLGVGLVFSATGIVLGISRLRRELYAAD
jgi:uncharacterized iron-regulated membrane protein